MDFLDNLRIMVHHLEKRKFNYKSIMVGELNRKREGEIVGQHHPNIPSLYSH